MSTTWVPIGPSCVPNGQLAIRSFGFLHPLIGTGVVSGRVSALAFSPDGKIVYAGAASGGVWKSSDDGASWTPLMDAQATLAVGSIATVADPTPTEPNRYTIYVGTGEANDARPDNSGVMPGIGILISHDEGASWTVFPPQDPTAAANDLLGAQIGRIVVDPAHPDQLVAATSKGLLVTDLATFKILNAGAACTDVAVDFFDPAHPRVFAAFRGPDSGDIVEAIGFPHADADLHTLAPPKVGGRVGLALERRPGQHATLNAALERDTKLDRLVRFDHTSNTWGDVANWDLLRNVAQLDYNLVFEIDPRDPERMFFGETKLYRKTHDKIWHLVSGRSGFLALGSYQGVHDDQHAIAFHPTKPDTVWLGNDGGVYRSTDGGEEFYPRNRSRQTLQLYSFSQHPTEPELLFAGTQDNGAVRYVGHPAWKIVRGGDVFGTAIHPAMPNVWFGAPDYGQGRVMRSLLHGVDGSFDDRGKGLADFSGKPWAVIAVDPKEGTRSFVGIDLLYWSHGANAHGGKWELIDASDDGELAEITAIAIAPSNSSILYYARSPWNGAPFPNDGAIHRLELVGDTWTHVGTSPDLGDNCHQILIDAADPDRFVAVLGGWGGPGDSVELAGRIQRGVFSSGAITLTPLGPLHPTSGSSPGVRSINGISIKNDVIQCNGIVRDPDFPTTLFVGTDYGVYRSLDAGSTWSVFGTGLPAAAVVTSIYLHPTSRRLRVSTMGRGLWECALDEADRDCDLYIRDCLYDFGRGTTRATRSDPGGLGELHWTDAPDLKLDTESIVLGSFEMPSSVHYDGAELDYVGFEALEGDAPRARSTSRVYVQVHNRGPNAIADVQVRVFVAVKSSTGYPPLPNDFWTTFATAPFADGAWLALGPAKTLHQLRAAEPQVARFDHTFHGADDTIGLLAIASSPSDPVPALVLDVEQAARADKHVVLKELGVKTAVLEIVVETLAIVGLLGLATYEVAK